MSRRKELRVKAVLPVKVTGVDASARHFSLMCHTLDLTYDSARIAGISASLMRGQTVLLHRFGVKAKFKVHWIGSGTRKGQYGLKSLEPEKGLWGIGLPLKKQDEFWTQPSAKDRRRFPRYPCSGGLEIITVFEYPFWAELTDISATGVYATTPCPLPRHTLVRIRVTVGEFLCEAHAEVMTTDPGHGMGMRFTVLSHRSMSELRAFLSSLPMPEETTKQKKSSEGWNEKSVRKILHHYDTQSNEETVAEDEAAYDSIAHTAMEVPVDLVPKVRELIAKRHS